MANLITTPRLYKNKALLLKTEVTVGTDSVPTGAANWIEARNVQITPMEAETAERNIDQPYLGNGGKLQVAQYVKLSFEAALTGGGAAGTAPKIAPALLACGFAETITASTSAAYNLVSTGHGACSIYMNMDGTLHKMIGARGTVSVVLNARAIPLLRFEFDAIFVDPTAVALPAVTTTGWQVEEPVNATNSGKLTVNSVDLAYSAFDLSLNNQLARINLPGPQVEVAITDRGPSGSFTVLCPALGVFDPFALAKAGTNVTLNTTHGTAAGKKAQIDAKIVLTDVGYDQIDGMAAYRVAYEATPVSGNDEFAITIL